MILSCWAIDWLCYVVYVLVVSVCYSFVGGRVSMVRYMGMGSGTGGGMSGKYVAFVSSNARWQVVVTRLVGWVFVCMGLSLFYWSGYMVSSNTWQMSISNFHWFYYVCLWYIFGLIFASFSGVCGRWAHVLDLRCVILGLLAISQIFLNVSGLFIVLFLIECQGIFIIYFLVVARDTVAVRAVGLGYDTRNYLYRRYFLQLNVLLVQFWAAFVATLLLIVAIVRLVVVGGCVTWVDLNFVNFFFIFKYNFMGYMSWVLLWGVFLLGMFANLGAFPFHFWKPELYSYISLWGMMWYTVFLTFVLVFLCIVMCSVFLENNISVWYWVVYVLQLGGLILLPNILLVLVELSVFIAYMSVFHMMFMFMFLLANKWLVVTFAINYLMIYTLVVIYFFFVLLLLRNKEINFLTDLHLLEQSYVLGGVVVNAIAVMCGVPPFAGFWLKVSIVVNLLHVHEVFLGMLAFIIGLYLMYFYMQNYRFVGRIRFTWNYTSLYINSQLTFVVGSVGVLLIMCTLSAVFVNDVLNMIGLINWVSLLQW